MAKRKDRAPISEVPADLPDRFYTPRIDPGITTPDNIRRYVTDLEDWLRSEKGVPESRLAEAATRIMYAIGLEPSLWYRMALAS
jgi:hypothetical protein